MQNPGMTTTDINEFAFDDLGTSTEGSIAHELEVIEKHFHTAGQCFGNLSNDMDSQTPIKFTVVGGNNAWGTELMLTDGTVIESGSATKKFDLNTLFVVSTSAANKITVVDLLYSPIATAVACTFDFEGGAADDIVVSAGHGLENGDKVVLKAGGGALATGFNDYTCYYVVGKGTDYFQVALTVGGAAVVISDDGGAAFWYPVNAAGATQGAGVQTEAGCIMHSAAAVNSDSQPFSIAMPKIGCNQRLFIRAKSETGSTISIGFLLGLHTYAA